MAPKKPAKKPKAPKNPSGPTAPDILTVTLNPVIDISSEAESVHPIHKIRTFEQRQDPGGGGVNVARVITKLGGSVQAVYLAGSAMGELLGLLLDRQGVDHVKYPIAGETRIAFNVYERKSGFEYRFLPEGPDVSHKELDALLDHVRRFEGRYVVVSGSLPRGLPEDVLVRIARICADNGQRFIVDSSGPALIQVLEHAQVFLVKPSLRELGQVAGMPLDDLSARGVAMDIVKKGKCEMVTVTLGVQGAVFAHASGLSWLPARHVPTKSAVGAGDSFLAAMVWALADGWDRAEAFRLGVAAGAAAALTPGTELCLKQDVFRLYQSAHENGSGEQKPLKS